MSVVVWVMMGIALWHFAVLFPDRFWGGIVGTFIIATAGAFASGYLLPTPGIPPDNPPGIAAALAAIPGAAAAMAGSYFYGSRREDRDPYQH
jgi:hypothetical protein